MDYELLLVQWTALLSGEENLISVLSNTSALIKEFYGDKVNWAGFYFMEGTTLVLGPFQGKIACMRLPYGKGVCQKAVLDKGTVIVTNVHNIADHIACDSASNSEIVIPIYKGEEIFGVLDIDSPNFDQFQPSDALVLQKIVKEIEKKL